MCGIIGAISHKDVTSLLLEGLKRLEYRGYDSAGLAIIDSHHHLQRLRTLGKIQSLESSLNQNPITGEIGIAHTRWATHGKPSEVNAHPHIVGEIALVHNGIIENHEKIRAKLLNENCQITSDTDSELIAHLIYQKIKKGIDFLSIIQNLKTELEGSYALAILFAKEPEHMIAIRHGSPLVIGLDTHQHFVSSDTFALLPFTQQFILLENGDVADIYHDKVTVYDKNNTIITRPVYHSISSHDMVNKGEYSHYMLKEIFEQPLTVLSTLENRISDNQVLIESFGHDANHILKKIKRIQIVACGTSFHAGLIGKIWLETIAKLSCQVEIASEFRYRDHVVEPGTLLVTLSQSGETADTIAALRYAKELGFESSLTICNVAESTLVRESELVFLMHAGQEIGVASTKSFTSQLIGLMLLCIVMGRLNELSHADEMQLVKALLTLPDKVAETLTLDKKIKEIANLFINKSNALFIGRGLQHPIALEGALKLKEISYIHAEAYAAGELKHGALALVDANMPVIALAPNDELIEKLKSNLEEVHSREGRLIIFADKESHILLKDNVDVITMPAIVSTLSPILYVIPLQLLAYYIALLKGTNIDQPRNLAKSVTVE